MGIVFALFYVCEPVCMYVLLLRIFVFRTRRIFQKTGLPDFTQTHVHVSRYYSHTREGKYRPTNIWTLLL